MGPISHLESQVKTVADIIAKNRSFCVLEHQKPDGDCIGSGLAMVLSLKALGKRAVLISEDPHPAIYEFLPGRQFHTRASYLKPEDFSPDVAIFLDCTGKDRAGSALKLAEGKVWINIDHHISNSHFGAVNLVDPCVSATGELVYQVISALGVEITQEIATCLYVAIATDTGGFRYQNTSSSTLRMAADLLDKGVKAWEVSESVFETRTVSSVLLLASALSTLKLYLNGKVAAVTVTKEMLRSSGASMEETEGIINYPRSISGVEVALLFKETEDGKGVHVSFRSRASVDVAELAVSMGGGGHPRAAGALLQGDLEDVKETVLSAIKRLGPWTDS